jgi:hypothetical protein
MASKRITVSVPAELAGRIKRAAGRRSVSEWVASAAVRALEEEDLKRQFLEFCDSVDAAPAEERRAQASFEQITRGKPTRRTTGRGRSAA